MPPERLTVAEVTRRRREAHSRRSSSGRWSKVAVALVLVAALTSGTAVATNACGAGDKFERLARKIQLVVNRPPDRPTVATVDVTPAQTDSPDPTASLAPATAAAPPAPAPVPKP